MQHTLHTPGRCCLTQFIFIEILLYIITLLFDFFFYLQRFFFFFQLIWLELERDIEMTNKNGSVVPAAQELETFLPIDSVNGVTKWVCLNVSNIIGKNNEKAKMCSVLCLEKRNTIDIPCEIQTNNNNVDAFSPNGVIYT